MLVDILNLEVESVVNDLKGQKILIYGSNGTGKTRQSMNFEKPLLLMSEAGGSAIVGKKTAVTDWATFVHIVNTLTNDKTREEAQKQYQTIILDTVESFVYLSEEAICKEFNVRDLSEMNDKKDIYGKQLPNGYLLARNSFRQQINKLSMYGYTVVFITHEEVAAKIDEFTGEAKPFIIPFKTENEKSSNRFVRDLADFTFYIRSNGLDPETNKPLLSTAICQETSYAFARSRYDFMPVEINPFTAENVTKHILEAIKKDTENQNGTLKTFELNLDKQNVDQVKELIKPVMAKLFNFYPDKVQEIVVGQLGQGGKVSEATEEHIENLKSIYVQLRGLADDRGVIVE